MPFDPNFPPHNAELLPVDFRNQFNALHDGITAIPQGPRWPQGDPAGEELRQKLNELILNGRRT